MARWFESKDEDFYTVSSSIPKELVPLLDSIRGTKTRSRFIRELIEREIEERETQGANSAA